MTWRYSVPTSGKGPGKSTTAKDRPGAESPGTLFPGQPNPLIFDDIVDFVGSDRFSKLMKWYDAEIEKAFCPVSSFQKGVNMSEVSITGNTLREAKQAIFESDRRPMLTIDPIILGDRDRIYPLNGFKAPPTNRFTIRWNGRNESFIREAIGLAEVIAIVKPILREYELSLAAQKKQEAKYDADCLEKQRNQIQQKIKESENNRKVIDQNIAGLKKQLDELS